MSYYSEFGPAPGNCSNLSVSVANNDTVSPTLTFKWQDPTEGVWSGTILVIKDGEYPRDETDGIIIADSTKRDEYKTEGIVYNVPIGSHHYCCAVFPYSPLKSVNRVKATTAKVEVDVNNTTPNKAILQSLYDSEIVLARDQYDYRPSSYNAYKSKMSSALSVLNSSSVTQSAIDSALVNLQTAIDGLLEAFKSLNDYTWAEIKDIIASLKSNALSETRWSNQTKTVKYSNGTDVTFTCLPSTSYKTCTTALANGSVIKYTASMFSNTINGLFFVADHMFPETPVPYSTGGICSYPNSNLIAKIEECMGNFEEDIRTVASNIPAILNHPTRYAGENGWDTYYQGGIHKAIPLMSDRSTAGFNSSSTVSMIEKIWNPANRKFVGDEGNTFIQVAVNDSGAHMWSYAPNTTTRVDGTMTDTCLQGMMFGITY